MPAAAARPVTTCHLLAVLTAPMPTVDDDVEIVDGDAAALESACSYQGSLLRILKAPLAPRGEAPTGDRRHLTRQ